MPKAATTKSAKSSTKSSPDESKKKLSAYQQWCKDNREQFKLKFPELKPVEVATKLSEAWWDAEENPKRGQRPLKRPKKSKDGKKEKGAKTKGDETQTEASSDS